VLFLLYDLFITLTAALWLPVLLLRCLVRGRPRAGLLERMGGIAPNKLARVAGRQVIWIHAVSVGETRAAVPLLQALRAEFPASALVLTNTTETGHGVAANLGLADLCLYFPFDFSWAIRRYLRSLDPALILVIETEIWPNLTRQARQRGIPLLLVNGRLSDRSFPRYHRLKRLLQPILRRFSHFCMQSQLDTERMLALGAPAERVEHTGNLKFDYPAHPPAPERVRELQQRYRIAADVPVWVAGSTHKGEEMLLARVFRRLLLAERQLVLVLVPRHPERCGEVEEVLRRYGFPYRRRSTLTADTPQFAPGEVLLVDTIGELTDLYAAADLIFVGGSLVPVGGHNLLEPAALQKPGLWGPHMHNFRDISRLLQQQGGGRQVAQVDELYDAVRELLDRPEEGRRMGAAAAELLSLHAGATERVMGHIRQLLQS